MLPYVEAIGEPRLGDGAVARRVAGAWRELRVKLDEQPATPPVRAFVNHYPRPELPGRCVAIQTVIYDVFDLFIAGEKLRAYATHARLEAGEEIPGRILELRQVWQLEGTPRLVAAMVQVTTRIRFPSGPGGSDFDSFPDPLAVAVLSDEVASAHFPIYRGGDRHGLAWMDRACGAGVADPVRFSYVLPARPQLDESPREGDDAIAVTAVEEDVAARLRAYVVRA